MQFPSLYFSLIYSLPQLIWNQGNINKTKLNVQTFELSRHLADIESYFLKMEIMLGKDFHEDAQIEIVLNLKQARN